MFLRPFFSYFGSKFYVCQRRYYPDPMYETIVEPFAGSAGYSVNCFRRKVVLYDMDPVIYGVWNYLIHVKASEIRALPDKVETTEELKIPQEAKWLIGFWLSRGQPRPSKKPSAWMKKWKNRRVVGYRYYWGNYVRGMIASQVKYIRHWRVYNKSFEQCPNRQATWYIDPPYQGNPGRSYKCHQIDFGRLGEWCRSRLGQVIVCENVGADWLPFKPLKSIKASVRKGRKLNVSKEAVWIKTDRYSGFKNLWQ